MDEVFSSRPDLRDQPLKDPNTEYFTDGSSFVKRGERLAGYSVVTLNSVIEVEPLPKGTSAQKAELIGLTRALQLAAGIHVNIYTDSKYAFTTLHIHGTLYKDKDIINSGGKDIWKSSNSYMLCRPLKECQSCIVGDIKGEIPQLHGMTMQTKTLADQEAKLAASKGTAESVALTSALFPSPLAEWDPNYSQHESTWFKTENEATSLVDDGNLKTAE